MLQQLFDVVNAFLCAHPFFIVYAMIGMFLVATLHNIYGKHNTR